MATDLEALTFFICSSLFLIFLVISLVKLSHQNMTSCITDPDAIIKRKTFQPIMTKVAVSIKDKKQTLIDSAKGSSSALHLFPHCLLLLSLSTGAKAASLALRMRDVCFLAAAF